MTTTVDFSWVGKLISPVSSDGELEQEVDENRIVTDQDKEQAAELKQKANKAFASEYLSHLSHLPRFSSKYRPGGRGCDPSSRDVTSACSIGTRKGGRKVYLTFLSFASSPCISSSLTIFRESFWITPYLYVTSYNLLRTITPHDHLDLVPSVSSWSKQSLFVSI